MRVPQTTETSFDIPLTIHDNDAADLNPPVTITITEDTTTDTGYQTGFPSGWSFPDSATKLSAILDIDSDETVRQFYIVRNPATGNHTAFINEPSFGDTTHRIHVRATNPELFTEEQRQAGVAVRIRILGTAPREEAYVTTNTGRADIIRVHGDNMQGYFDLTVNADTDVEVNESYPIYITEILGFYEDDPLSTGWRPSGIFAAWSIAPAFCCYSATIVSSDSTVAFGSEVTEVTEGETATLSVVVTPPHRSQAINLYATASDSAVQFPDGASLTIPASRDATSTARLRITLPDDTVAADHPDLTITLTADDPDTTEVETLPAGWRFPNAAATYTLTLGVVDDEKRVVGFNLVGGRFAERNTNYGIQYGIQNFPAPRHPEYARLSVAVKEGEPHAFEITNLSNNDTRFQCGTLSTACNTDTLRFETARFVPVDDNIPEPDETIILTMTANHLPSASWALGNDEYAITIRANDNYAYICDDDDTNTALHCAGDTDTVNEITEGGQGQLVVELTNPLSRNFEDDGPDEFRFEISIKEGKDKANIARRLGTGEYSDLTIFTDGEKRKVFTINALEDADTQDDEITLEISSFGAPSRIWGTNDEIITGSHTHTITIRDNDAASGGSGPARSAPARAAPEAATPPDPTPSESEAANPPADPTRGALNSAGG